MYGFIKRAFDIAVSLFILVLFSPAMLIISIAIRISDGGHIIFRQRRPGKDCKIFTVYKFRTMKEKTTDENGNELSDMERYNPSSIRSSVPHPFRQYFFRMLGKRNFSVLVENCMKPSKLIRLHRKILKLFADN